jgi:hypothetical protein
LKKNAFQKGIPYDYLFIYTVPKSIPAPAMPQTYRVADLDA